MQLVLLAVFIGTGYHLYRQSGYGARAPRLTYVDVEGRSHAFASPCKPAVVAFWRAAPSSRYDRVLDALEILRRQHAESRIDVVSICLDRLKTEDVAAGARQAKRTVAIAVAQTGEDHAVKDALVAAFKPGEPGDEIFVVDADGRIHRVDATGMKETPASLAVEVESLLKNVQL